MDSTLCSGGEWGTPLNRPSKGIILSGLMKPYEDQLWAPGKPSRLQTSLYFLEGF